ncbi:MAG: exo-alpha-sialidase [Saprospiraceae bacterium]|nr:exo-alpha-sialidase [Saprospiraceae bacterium]
MPTFVYQYAKSSNRVYAATSHGLFKSVDNGEQWVQMTNLPTNTTRNLLVSGDMVFVIQTHRTYDANAVEYIAIDLLRSSDGGQNFETPQVLALYENCYGCNWLAVQGLQRKEDGTLYFVYREYLSSGGFTPIAKYSTDNGQTWFDLTTVKVAQLFFEGNTAYCTHQDTLYVGQQADFSDAVKLCCPLLAILPMCFMLTVPFPGIYCIQNYTFR